MIPDKSLSFAKAKKSDNLMKFPTFLFLGFLNSWNLLSGFDIMGFRFLEISSQVRLKVKTPGTTLRSVMVTAGEANCDVATVVTSIRSTELMHIGMPSLVT
uniref:Uncharacterized protein n=1 Tax=Arundo donax TaxID=35708 RepID=A0A0A9F5R7_ARUDO